MRKSIAEEFINLVLQAVGSEFRVGDTGEGLSDDHPKPVNSGESRQLTPYPLRTPDLPELPESRTICLPEPSPEAFDELSSGFPSTVQTDLPEITVVATLTVVVVCVCVVVMTGRPPLDFFGGYSTSL